MEAGLARRLDWAARRVELPAGRYETILPPSAAADLFIYLYWSAGAKDALDGRTVFSKAGGGTRVGERLAGLPPLPHTLDRFMRRATQRGRTPIGAHGRIGIDNFHPIPQRFHGRTLRCECWG